MKTREEIKTGLEYCSQNVPYPCNGCPYERDELLENAWRCNLNADVIALIQQLEKQNEQIRWERDVAIDQLKQLGIGFGEKVDGKMPKWTSVEERLPERGRYLVITQKGVCGTRKVHTATYNHLGWWTYADFGEITHWMPLPKPQKEG